MSMGDIFRIDFHFENPTGVGQMGHYLRETVENATSIDECKDIANGSHDAIIDDMLPALSDDWYFAAIVVSKVFGDPRPRYERSGKDLSGLALGTEPGPGLPANDCMNFELVQNTFPVSSNGLMQMPGLAEPKANIGNIDSTFLNGPLNALAAALQADVTAPADAGTWEVGIISPLVRDVALPAKDWAGAFAVVTDIAPQPIIGIQSGRRTKASGVSTSL